MGTAQFAAVPGKSALFTTVTGTISAVATNFCYGNCLLAKVEGTWYAINPADNREVVRSSVDRLIQRKATVSGKPTAWLAIGQYGLPFLGFDPDLIRESQLSTNRNAPLNFLIWIWIPRVTSFELFLEVSGGTPADFVTNPNYSQIFNGALYEIARLGWLAGLIRYEFVTANSLRFFGSLVNSEAEQLTSSRYVPNRFFVSQYLVEGNYVEQKIAVDGLDYTVVKIRCQYLPGLYLPITNIPLTFNFTLTDSGEFDIVRSTVKFSIT
ncbi:hypothetical protein [Chamaesiphon sp. OTE_8_metabat_110]|uniref:hypothetical protein n=1 Tax=Chamaesiphon sp. OTE_8_metabat_110 TaxID=2964696 RepID=UPI00286A44FA|nr:hypothetical protein [Chamaesiphon sp. OTE_8_metabat_110]